MKKRIVTLFMTLQARLNCYQSAGSACIVFLLVTCSLPLVTSQIHAQTVPVSTQKKVVSTYEINNPDQLFPFPGPDCPEKDKGDANCDRNVNFFDLSIWQIEANNPQGSKRADFNNDSFVDMTDYGIWRGTFYGEEVSSLGCSEFQSVKTSAGTIAKLLYCYIAESQTALSQQFNNLTIKQLLPPVLAQSQTPGTGNIHRSLPFITANDTSLILNQNSDGTTSEIRLDENSNPSSSLVLDVNGNVTAQANFTGTGDEWVITDRDGITVQTLKKIEGPVFQYFKDAAGTTLAVKSWPNLPSIEANDPPLAVTLPVKNNWLTLSINPNGTSIVAQTDNEGSVLKQTQYRGDGSYISQDNRYQTFSEANEKIGLLTINMPNSLGGRTTYNFYKGGLYAIVQTDKNNDYYIAKPADGNGDSWILESSLSHNLKTVTDPIGEVGSNTPGPDKIIADINYYRSIPNQNSISFSDGFGTNSRIFPEQIAKANQILNIDGVSPPQTKSWNFGIPEIFAEGSGNSSLATSGAGLAAPATTAAAATGIGSNTAQVTVNTDGSQTNTITGANGQQLASATTGSNANTIFSSGGSEVAVNSGYIPRFVPATPGGGTPVSFSSGGPTTCFLAGTKISTPNGPVDIEKLKPGMKVYSFNEETRQKELANFDQLDINFVDEYLIINDKIQTTTYHPFYVVIPTSVIPVSEPESRKTAWIPHQVRDDREQSGMKDKDFGLLSLVKAGRLKVGDLLVDESNNIVPITSIQKITKKETVYNLLTVTPNNNFYAQGFLVHNYNSDVSRNNFDPSSNAGLDADISGQVGDGVTSETTSTSTDGTTGSTDAGGGDSGSISGGGEGGDTGGGSGGGESTGGSD